MALDPSLFVSDTVFDRPVTLADGSQHTFWFKEVPAVAFRAFQIAEHSFDDEVRASSMCKLIAASVCEPDGKPAMTFEQAQKLKPAVMNALMKEVLLVNKIGSAAKKDSPPEGNAGSGTPSP